MGTTQSGPFDKSTGSKWLRWLVIVMLVMAAIVAFSLFMGWVLGKIAFGSVIEIFRVIGRLLHLAPGSQ